MKRRIIFTAICCAIVILPLQSLYAFDNKKTHPAITERAVVASTIDDYLKTQVGLNDGISTQLFYDFPSEIQTRIRKARWSPEKTQRSILEWLKVGSAIEDTDNTPFYRPIRPRHHFHDPTRNTGLDNKTDHPEWRSYAPAWGTFYVFDFTGESALTWAVAGTAPQNPTTNNQTWHNARTDFYNSLTKSLTSDREKYLAMTFLDLGCVLHMIEDMGVPAHARNDFLFAHYRDHKHYSEPLERWIERMIPSNGSLERWIPADWIPVPRIFYKVSNYFDTNAYDADYLDDGLPPDTWGLSESTNYQFLSWSTMFVSDMGSLYYFPHPNRASCDTTVESGRTYLYGYGVDHLAQKTMSQHHLVHNHLDKAWCVLGKTIYDNYADITLPRTIDYAAGLINYFFRGSIDVAIGCPQGCDPATNTATYTMTITNTSMNTNREQVLKGGTFEFYWEDWSGDRAQATALTVYTYDPCDPCTTQLWNGNSILPYGEHIRAQVTFDVLDCTDIKDYAVIYKGAINDFEHPDDTDPDDAEALACWTKSASYSAPPQSYTLFVTESGGTDEYSECAAYLESIFNSENPDGYTLNKTPDSSCLDCRWYEMDYHTCPYGSPYCYSGCNIAQIMILRSPSSNSFCVIITPFPVAYCGFGPSCNGSYKRCFYKQAEESYADFWDRIFNGGVFGDGSETDDSWVRVMWIPTAGMAGGEGGMAEMDGGESISALPGVEGLLAETSAQASSIPSEPTTEEQIEQLEILLDWLDEIKDEIDEDIWLNLSTSLEEMLKELQQE